MKCIYCEKNFDLKDYHEHLQFHKHGRICSCCSLLFDNKNLKDKHEILIKKRTCESCKKLFSSVSNKKNHEQKNCPKKQSIYHDEAEKILVCEFCHETYKQRYVEAHKRSYSHLSSILKHVYDNVDSCQIGGQNKVKIYRINNANTNVDTSFDSIFLTAHDTILNILEKELLEHKYLKFKISLIANFEKDGENENKRFDSMYSIIYPLTDKNELVNSHSQTLIDDASEMVTHGSGWCLNSVKAILIHIIKQKNPFGSSYIPTPQKLKRKKCIINVENKQSSNCFLLSILAYFFRHEIDKKNWEKEESYNKFMHKFKFDKLLPMTFNNQTINKFIQLNKNFRMKINIYMYDIDEREFGVLRAEEVNDDKNYNFIDLLLLSGKNFGHYHFTLCLDLSALVKTSLTRTKNKIYICRSCLSYFAKEINLTLHNTIGCFNVRLQITKNPFLNFKDYGTRLRKKVVIYSDIECCAMKIDSCENSLNKSFSENLTKHEPICCGYYIDAPSLKNKKFENIFLFNTKNCMEEMLISIVSNVKQIMRKYFIHEYKRTEISQEIKNYFNQFKNCFLCGKVMNRKNQILSYDHDHYISDSSENFYKLKDAPKLGNIRMFVHQECNLNMREQNHIIPVLFHSGSSYDFYFVCNALSNLKIGRINILAKNSENYISIDLIIPFKLLKQKYFIIRFIDSYKIISQSLSQAVSCTENFDLAKKLINQKYPSLNVNKKMLSKQALCYEYIDSPGKMKETSLPDHIAFKNTLNNTLISIDEYEQAKVMWKKANCQTLADYILLYLTFDIALLAQVYENFRDECYRYFSIDISHFRTIASFSLQCCLSYTKHNIPLNYDLNMYSFIQRNLTGANSFGGKHFVEANNKYLSNFDNSQEQSQIVFFDVNGLYSHVMCNFLMPDGEYTWITEDEKIFLKNNLITMTGQEDYGAILEVDINFPDSIHDRLKEWPPLHSKMKVKNSNSTKIVPSLYNKKSHVCHYLLIIQALKLGAKLIDIKRGIKFRQTNWLQKYIEFNISIRKEKNSNEFSKNIFKLLNNVIYGKMAQNQLNFCNFLLFYENKLADDEKYKKKFSKIISNPRVKNVSLFDNKLVGIELKKTKITIQSANEVAMAILDLGKYYMTDLFHNILTPLCGLNNIELILHDTDSFCLLIKNVDMYEIIRKNPDLFDTSSYAAADNRFNIIPKNAKVSGLLADEAKGRLISSVIYLAPKMYAIKYDENERNKEKENSEQLVIKKGKGITRSALKNIVFDEYREVVQTNSFKRCQQLQIKHKLHSVYTSRINKISLKKHCIKKYFISNHESLPWGHKSIKHVQSPFEY